MIRARKLCDLDVSAASGLVAHGDRLYVVADDELFLSVYDRDGRALRRVPLFEGSLPGAQAARKAARPDLESIALLPDDSLLALGSGSTPNRGRGAWISPSPSRTPRPVDLAPLYAHLRAHELPELNIEGAAPCGDRLRLLQRGNGAARDNAVIDLDLAAVLAALAAGCAWDASLVRTIHHVSLGDLAGVPLSFTDAAPGDDGTTLFTAAAEDHRRLRGRPLRRLGDRRAVRRRRHPPVARARLSDHEARRPHPHRPTRGAARVRPGRSPRARAAPGRDVLAGDGPRYSTSRRKSIEEFAEAEKLNGYVAGSRIARTVPTCRAGPRPWRSASRLRASRPT